MGKAGGVEEKIYINVADERIDARPEKDIDRTSAEGKASSVQFLHFNFTEKQIEKFKDNKNEVWLAINHNTYNHKVKILEEIRNALIKDFI